MKTFVGVDYHKHYSYGTIVDEAGQVLKRGRFANRPEALNEFLGQYGGPGCSAVLEATRNWCVMHDWLEAQVEQVALAHPLKVRAIAEARVKTDKIDAATLAHLLRCDLLPQAHVASPQARAAKQLLRQRMFLVKLRTMVKNRIHALIDRHPQVRATRRAHELFLGTGMAWLESVELPPHERRLLDELLATLRPLNEQVARFDRWVAQMGRADERVQRLMTIPGIGRCLALLIVHEIDDISRFSRPAKLHAYAGLVPSTYASGGKTFHGRITRQGNPYLRWAMIEAIWPAMRRDRELRSYYERLKRHKGANKAKVAAARRLLTIVYRLWTQQREYHHAA